MKNILPLLLSALLLQGCLTLSGISVPTRNAIAELDRILENNSEIISKKEARISEMRRLLGSAQDPQSRYRVCCGLCDEYYKFDLDSALYYIYMKMSLAGELGDDELKIGATLDLAGRYLISGMYYSAKDLIESIDKSRMSPEQLGPYYQAFTTLYHNLVLVNKDSKLTAGFREQEMHYRQLSLSISKPSTLNYNTEMAEALMSEGKNAEARKLLLDYLENQEYPNQNLAIIHYWIAKTYKAEGNKDQALMHYAISARHDMAGSVRASRSIIQASVLLLDYGQPERAYRYIHRAYQDAVKADARICQEEIARFMPEITSTYDRMNTRRIRELIYALVLVALLLAVSVVGLLLIRSLQKKVLKANQEIKDGLVKMKEANVIKEIYMGRYMSMFSSHINGIEQYRSSIRNVAKSKDMDQIMKALRSDDFIDNQRETLYAEFDHAFLGMFPDFVSQLNSMLKEDQRIGKKLKDGQLNSELRIFALIRLGVNESSQIASFLKKSPSTIYNYRVKLRNASIYPYDEFERHVMEIGTPGWHLLENS